MPSIYQDWICAVLRHLLTVGAGMLITKGYLGTDAANPQVIAGLALAIGTIGLSAYQKFTAKQLQLVAQATAGRSTTADLTAYLAAGLPAPSVLTPATMVPTLPLDKGSLL